MLTSATFNSEAQSLIDNLTYLQTSVAIDTKT